MEEKNILKAKRKKPGRPPLGAKSKITVSIYISEEAKAAYKKIREEKGVTMDDIIFFYAEAGK